MGRNIVLFSDGTGNKGGTGSDTNVFKLYHAVKGGKNNREQFAYYDNGVGTSTQAAFRAIGGATGFGFRRNVRDLYEFTGRHYQDGDDIYGFGFSRGAATIRPLPAWSITAVWCISISKTAMEMKPNWKKTISRTASIPP